MLRFFSVFLYHFCGVARKKERERHTSALRRACVVLPLGRRNSSEPLASASAPANELAKQLPASASGLAVPPPAANTAEAVDLSAGAAIRGLLLLLLLRRVQASPVKKLNAGVTCIKFSIYRICL